MIKISVIGFGNVGQHLASAFQNNEKTELVQVFSRSGNSGDFSFSDKIISDLDDLLEADIYVISVSDKAVADVSKSLAFADRLVVHTAGSLGMDVLDRNNRKGIFYPLQTFSKSKNVEFKNVPICVEAENADDLALLESVAHAISQSVFLIDSRQRKALHVSAVFVSNFANHMYKIGSDICREHDMPFEILKPLILETADKIKSLSPEKAQTGPAIRHDQNTIESHLALLSDANQKNIYELLTSSIQK
ncbi:Rossmann-like and DUF2520 domain-containing protein [Flavobacterium sp.]|uniref:Rossmann-like and DUF2520 domain-containing protein n=1 Tax=Flavobacterium sp. TaxID=239 RepID=UPI0012215BE0|nr:Rossmann-like and DUF2520 domain-containing protein [Flavobacterium sp.]RZJ71031.1 MAG: DUF2520 domain-containing protein [Flavobacterium sp.]